MYSQGNTKQILRHDRQHQRTEADSYTIGIAILRRRRTRTFKYKYIYTFYLHIRIIIMATLLVSVTLLVFVTDNREMQKRRLRPDDSMSLHPSRHCPTTTTIITVGDKSHSDHDFTPPSQAFENIA